MTTIAVSPEAQDILDIPAATVDSRDARLMPGPGVNVYFLDAEGCIVAPGVDRPIVAVTASCTRGVPRRAHWGSLAGGGMGRVAGD